MDRIIKRKTTPKDDERAMSCVIRDKTRHDKVLRSGLTFQNWVEYYAFVHPVKTYMFAGSVIGLVAVMGHRMATTATHVWNKLVQRSS